MEQRDYTIKELEKNELGCNYRVQVTLPMSLGWYDDLYLVTCSDVRIGLISRYYHVNGMPVSCSDSTIRGLRFWFREVLSIAWSAFRGIVSSYN